MKPLDASGASGVIAPEADRSLLEQARDQAAAATQQASAVPSDQQAILDLPMPQLPADLPPIEPPEFVLAQKITEEGPGVGAGPVGMPGLSGLGAPVSTPEDVLSGLPPEASALIGDAEAVINHAAAPVLDAAHGVLGQAGSAVSNVLGGSSAASAASAAGAGATPAAAALPALPADPVGALMSGIALPALPGIDVLFKPILDLLGSFGTGVMGAFDPTAILSQSSKVIEMAMQVGKGSLGAVEQVWQSQAATAAQDAGQKANSEGLETSQRGIDISELTQRAAAVVQQGNAQLTAIATSFAGQAVALAPVIMTPPAQATLMATATEHLGQAVSVVNATRGDLAGKTAELNGLVSQLVGQNGPAPQEIAQAVMQNVGEPLMSQAEEVATTAAGFDSGTSGTNGLSTSAASYGSGGSAGSGGGAGAFGTGGFGRGGSGGSAGRAGSGGVAGIPSLPGTSGAPGGVALPGGMRAPVAGMPMGAGLGTTPASSSGFMGGPGAAGAAGQRNNNEDEHSRNVDPYRSRTGNDDLTGPLGESTPEVIGATSADEGDGSDYYQDQF
ncbi:hypothetical protein OG935_02940 [Nocardia cyriacigeorgica]|uniref:hypothetical protein n=1 Tax=Nocardia cyriacigeorgica TaxID=135487 RepID=UPI001894746F|nr:hypothetical protein [Nocardia cyriacigeorgica]MBF6322679.1 hypothetical protein [Nocardia cyriacigeorgica]MBF6495460.1 hypothetical protein [Nocardia cyriacigeorgica]